MLKPEHFRRTPFQTLKWIWGSPGDTGTLRVEFWDWQDPARLLSALELTCQDFESHYRQNGIPLPVPHGVPALIQITEILSGKEPNQFRFLLPDREGIPIHWRKRPGPAGTTEITVYYPDPNIVRPETYPENTFYFQVRLPDESPEQAARFYLPRPGESRSQQFWFDRKQGFILSLRIQDQPFSEKLPLLTTGSVFTVVEWN